jgi:transposase, IS30 family
VIVRRGRLPLPRSVRSAFWDGVRAGLSVGEAGVAAGAGRSAEEWFRRAGGVKANGPGPVCGRYLPVAEREEIAVGVAAGEPLRAIAARLGRAPSTVSREVRRNGTRRGYRAVAAQAQAEALAARPKTARLAGNARLRGWVQARLEERWSPEQVSRMLEREFPGEPEMRVSHEVIYQAIYVQGRGTLRRELASCLRTGRALRRPRRRADERRGRIPGMVMISERPAEVTGRAVPGHWEGDLIMGARNASAIGTLVERTTRFVMLLHLPHGHAPAAVAEAMTGAVSGLPAALRRVHVLFSRCASATACCAARLSTSSSGTAPGAFTSRGGESARPASACHTDGATDASRTPRVRASLSAQPACSCAVSSAPTLSLRVAKTRPA